MLDGYLTYPDVCGTHGPITYERDGKSHIWGEKAIWHLEGNVLTETKTFSDPMHTNSDPEDIGRQYVSTSQWVDHDRFLKRFADGDVREFRRCPKQN